jgi:predicted permease
MSGVLQDLRYAVRALRSSPGFTAAAVLTLALGVGANTAIFSVVNAVMVTPIPGIADPERLVWVVHTERGQPRRISYPDARDYRAQRNVFAGAAAVDDTPAHVASSGENQRVTAETAGGDYFSVLGVTAQAGRFFTAADEEARRPVVVLSDAWWRTRFGGDPAAIGQDLTVNGRSWTIIGVAPADFLGLNLERTPQLYVPLLSWLESSPRRASIENRSSSWLRLVARLQPGVSVSRAEAAVRSVALANAGLRTPDLRQTDAAVERLHGLVPAGHTGEVLPLAIVGLLATGLVLCIAAANVASLLLSRAVGRGREIAIRLAIGASRARVARHLLAESLVLATLGALAGVLVASWSLTLLWARFEPPAGLSPGVDARVLLYAIAVSLVTSVVFGLAPAWSATRGNVFPGIRDASERSGRPRGQRLQGFLVVVQMALSLVLLAAAGLFLRSLAKASAVPIGVDRSRSADVLALSFDLDTQGYSKERTTVFSRELLARASSLPGVQSAALAQTLPLSGRAIGDGMAPEGREIGHGEEGVVFLNTVSPRYFATLGVPLVAGRDFSEGDRPGTQGVVIVNETLARQFWPGASALGRRMRVGKDPSNVFEVVGVAGDGKYVNQTEAPRGFAYFSILQQGNGNSETILLVRSGAGAALAPSVRESVRQIDPTLPLFHLTTLARSLDAHSQDRRQGTLLVAVFGGLALLLSAVGLYGVVAHSAAQRTREVGVRVALGASPREVTGLFLRRGARLAAIGAATGLVVAAGVTRLLSGFLFGVDANDLPTFAAVAALLIGVALLSSFLPARRAARVDPIKALRET